MRARDEAGPAGQDASPPFSFLGRSLLDETYLVCMFLQIIRVPSRQRYPGSGGSLIIIFFPSCIRRAFVFPAVHCFLPVLTQPDYTRGILC